jgi:hypothetical protein
LRKTPDLNIQEAVMLIEESNFKRILKQPFYLQGDDFYSISGSRSVVNLI